MNDDGQIDQRDIADLRLAVEIGRHRRTLPDERRSLFLPRGAAVVDPEFLAQLLDAYERDLHAQESVREGDPPNERVGEVSS